MTEVPRAESGLQLLARLSSRPSLTEIEPRLFPVGMLHPKDVIELKGGPGSGKTLISMQLLAQCILPCNYKGLGASAILINTDHHFQITSLCSILESILKEGECPRVNLSRVLKESLKNLIILSCHDSAQLITTLHALPQHISAKGKVSLVVFDSPIAYYWSDSMASGVRAKQVSKEAYLNSVLRQTLSQGVSEQGINLLYTVPEAFCPGMKRTFSPPGGGILHHVQLKQISENLYHGKKQLAEDNQNYYSATIIKSNYNPVVEVHFTITASGINWSNLPKRELPMEIVRRPTY